MAKKEDIRWHEEVRALARSFAIAFAETPIAMTVVSLLYIVEGLVPAVIVAQTGRFIDLLGRSRAAGGDAVLDAAATRALMWAGGALVIGRLTAPLNGYLMQKASLSYGQGLARRVMGGVTAVPGLAHFEDPEFRDRLEVAEWLGWAPFESLWMFVTTLSQVAQIASLATVAAAFAGWGPAVIILASLPAGIMMFRGVKNQGLAFWHDSPEMKRSNYHRWLAMELKYAKELRIFGLRGFTLSRHHDHWLRGMAETWRQRRRTGWMVLGLRSFSIAAIVWVFVAMVNASLDGRLAPGAFFAAATASTYLLSQSVGVFSTVAWIRRMNYLLPVALKLIDLPRTDPRLEARGTLPAHGPVATGLRFEGVRFRYPGTDRWILDGIDLEIAPGQTVALVGENGAGKTTLIKLLCRFYDPTDGAITLDGVDIREMDLDQYRARIACIFQDFARYELSARHNVGFGAVDRLDDIALLRDAAGKVGALTEIEGLPDGWETVLSRAFDGVDLSGGQWQRIALARAMASQLGRDSDILILDEPTASLDVRLEHELYEHFAEIAAGRTTLLVSHRFSTVRMAERIIVLDAGKIVQDGDHATLVGGDGLYASLYRFQADHYVRTGSLS